MGHLIRVKKTEAPCARSLRRITVTTKKRSFLKCVNYFLRRMTIAKPTRPRSAAAELGSGTATALPLMTMSSQRLIEVESLVSSQLEKVNVTLEML